MPSSTQDQISYQQQFNDKVQFVEQLFAEYVSGKLSCFESPEKHYRMRAEFRVWHDGDETYHIMFDQQSKEKYKVEQFSAASCLINKAMLALIEALKGNQVMRTKLFQIDYLSSTTGELVISMLYHKKLDETWSSSAEIVRAKLAGIGKVSIIGRAKKQKVVLGNDFVSERYNINGQLFSFKQVENSFTQPNAYINEKMIEWVLAHISQGASDLLELYCGAGNFSVPLSKAFVKVFATEISKTSVNAAQDNIASNKVENLSIARLSSEEFVEAHEGKRQFFRLRDIDLSSYNFSHVLVDPPRSGLDDGTRELITKFDNIIYISCNPSTLIRDLETLCKTHIIEHHAMFDQFPFTPHVECGVILRKKNTK